MTRVAELLAQRLVGHEPRDLGGQRVGVARLEQQPEVARRSSASSYCGQARRHRHGAAGHRAHAGGAARAPCRPTPRRRCPRATCTAPRSPAAARRSCTRSRIARASGTDGSLARQPRPDRRLPRQLVRAACAARAGRSAARRAPPRPRRGSRRSRVSSRARPRREVGAGADHAVVAREVARHEVARDAEARGAPVEAAEQQLDDLAAGPGGEDALGGRVEGADVERARVAQRGRGGARRERLVHVDEVERGVVEQGLDRARHVDRQRHRPRPLARPDRDRLADRQHLGAAVVRRRRTRDRPRSA